MKTLMVKFVATINMMPLYPIGLTLAALKWNVSMLKRIHANKIAIEIKAGQPPREILRRFIAHAEQNFDAIVFIIASRRREIFEKTLISEKCDYSIIGSHPPR